MEIPVFNHNFNVIAEMFHHIHLASEYIRVELFATHIWERQKFNDSLKKVLVLKTNSRIAFTVSFLV